MIKTEDFIDNDFVDFDSEKKALTALVDAFAQEMKEKLIDQYHADWNGWDKDQYREGIEKAFMEQTVREKKDYVDIANFAAMLWNFEQGKKE